MELGCEGEPRTRQDLVSETEKVLGHAVELGFYAGKAFGY